MNPDKPSHLRKEVEYMLQNGIAEPSLSWWSSPCLLADKSDKSDRFCKEVNNVIKPGSYPLPRMDDCINRVGNRCRSLSARHFLSGSHAVGFKTVCDRGSCSFVLYFEDGGLEVLLSGY